VLTNHAPAEVWIALAEKAPAEVWIALSEKLRKPRLDRPRLRVARFSGPALTQGIETARPGSGP